MLKVKGLSQLEQKSEDDKWLIEGLWLNEGIGMLTAQPKTGKSWCGLDIAVSVASGQPCLNKYPVKQASKVLFFNAEDTEAIQRDRFEAIKKAKGIQGELGNLGVVTSEEGLRLDLDAGIESLRAIVAEHKPALLILDPFVRMHQISESDSTAVAKILSGLRKIKNDFKCGVLLVHHSTKGSKNIRGSTEFPAWGETNLFMYKDKLENVYLDIQHRAAESTNAIPLKIGELNDGVCLHVIPEHKEEEIVSPIVTPEQKELSAREQMLALIDSRICGITLKDLSSRLYISEKEAANHVYLLIKEGHIRYSKNGYLKQ